MFIDEECGNLIVANNGGEISSKEARRLTIAYIDVHAVTNVIGESICSVTLWNIYCESVR